MSFSKHLPVQETALHKYIHRKQNIKKNKSITDNIHLYEEVIWNLSQSITDNMHVLNMAHVKSKPCNDR